MVNGKMKNKKPIFNTYFNEVQNKYRVGNTTEMSFRNPLENLIQNLDNNLKLIEEPKKTKEVGIPDFRVYQQGKRMGYIETKDLGMDLNKISKSDQLKRYRNSINNIILTNYGEFLLIGEKSIYVNLFEIEDLDSLKYEIRDDIINKFLDMLEIFKLSGDIKAITSAEDLANELSKRGKVLKELAKIQLEKDEILIKNREMTSSIYDFYIGIKKLIHDINLDDCSDAYSQTIIFGLFLAKINNPDSEINKIDAAFSIPQNIAIIRKIFLNISDSLPDNLNWIVDEIIDILNATNVQSVLADVGQDTSTRKLAFLYFYEYFLGRYNPKKRKQKGVYFTPRPVVSFITNSINIILKKTFNKPSGFADDDVTVLDPAIGTGTFLRLVYLLTLLELKNKGLSGIINKKIENHILKDFYGFEILITPYVISHMNLTFFLNQWFYKMKETDRIQVYLTNTLEPHMNTTLMPFMREILEESKVANEIKNKKKILAILGNPPYAVTSSNKGKWIENLLKNSYNTEDGHRYQSYYEIDGKHLKEKKLWLTDDYVKFIRFAQWKIDTSGNGTIGFITNHAYLNNPTFRGMRQSLLESFHRIYIINLHGSSLRREKSPDGSLDENVFDIKPGVAISIFVKNDNFDDRKIYYYDLYGMRNYKYNWLDNNDILSVKWQEIEPQSPFYFFIPKENEMIKEYQKFWKITDIFSSYSVGIVTGRDKLTIQFSPDEIWDIVTDFVKLDSKIAQSKYKLGKDARDWKIIRAQQDLSENELSKDKITPILYRPFDVRYTYYTGKSRGFIVYPLHEVMGNMFKDNIALVFHRREELPIPYSHFFVTDKIAEHCCLSIKTTCSLTPLYIYKEIDGKISKSLNFNPNFIKYINKLYNREVKGENIFKYIYAISNSNIYRSKFDELLRDDFPRIPFVDDHDIFTKLVDLGENLINMHLMKIKYVSDIKYNIIGSNNVDFIKYDGNKILINKNQYFEGISREIWDFYLGGYKVLEKYLISRKGKELEATEIEHVIQIAEIINNTIQTRKDIDNIVKLFL